MLAAILNFVGSFATNVGSAGCFILWIDEPKMPKSLIK